MLEEMYYYSAYISHKIAWYTYIAQHWRRKEVHLRPFISAYVPYCAGYNGNEKDVTSIAIESVMVWNSFNIKTWELSV